MSVEVAQESEILVRSTFVVFKLEGVEGAWISAGAGFESFTVAGFESFTVV